MSHRSIKLCFVVILISLPQITVILDSGSQNPIFTISDTINIVGNENLIDFINDNPNIQVTTDLNNLELECNPTTKTKFQNDDLSIQRVVSTIAVLVNSLLYVNSVQIQSSVAQYVVDLSLTGYNVILYTDEITDAISLRSLLQEYYLTVNMTGAVFIGPFPYIEFYHPEDADSNEDLFICDLFFMDLDGDWYDLNNDRIYDKHNCSYSADILPEIYIGRIDASTRTLGGLTNKENILNVLDRVNSYRRGGVARTNRALSFIDDDWEAWANGTYDNWATWLLQDYEDVNVIYEGANTTALNWLGKLPLDYEFAHLCAHSSATTHYFYNPSVGGFQTVSSSQINDAPPSFNFYSLYCCHAAQWTIDDCLATTYLFAGNYSLAVISSSKTGGMNHGESFYYSLGNDMNIGESLYQWFQGIRYYNYYNYLEKYYGMCILGDPFLTIDNSCFVPIVSESTPVGISLIELFSIGIIMIYSKRRRKN